MPVLRDNGGGVTRVSLDYWNANKAQIGEVLSVACIDEDADYNTMVTGTKGVMYLSGFACGYSGTAPMALIDFLVSLGAPRGTGVVAKTVITRDSFFWTPQGGFQ